MLKALDGVNQRKWAGAVFSKLPTYKISNGH
jgi:hypothetical protein